MEKRKNKPEKNEFYERIVNNASNESMEALSIEPADIGDMMSDALVVLDFRRQEFVYVPNHDLCLCGYTQEAPIELGFNVSIWGKIPRL